ncbi:DUF3472 domain-containing protein [uncultured Rubinisphaera sp.]|uniref:DUF3472 domain-containing protein n=1 Tax=uncultured Rubinisphaera sp. TaxID=1678686 RepID=UPI0030DDC9B1
MRSASGIRQIDPIRRLDSQFLCYRVILSIAQSLLNLTLSGNDLMILRGLILTSLILTGTLTQAIAQTSAPSSHFVFDDHFEGDIIINEVRVPKSGEALHTYYEVLGWRGLGGGYAGIQAHPKAHNFIFSIWDHQEHTAPIRAVYRGPGTLTEPFGGEGTGLKSWNFELGWKTETWYTLVARNWPVDDHTYYGFWVQAGDTKVWTHLVTMDVAAANAVFQGGTDAFIEDWLNTGIHPRTTNLRNGWKRKVDGEWYPFASGRYSVNSWDLDPGNRSYDFRTNWDGGVDQDRTGSFYYMISGGAETKPTSENPSVHSIPRTEKTPSFPKTVISSLSTKMIDKTLVAVDWEIDSTTTPQFAYELKMIPVVSGQSTVEVRNQFERIPHARSATINIADLKSGDYDLHLQCTDILGRKSEIKSVRVHLQ